jgi:hypothetical protein
VGGCTASGLADSTAEVLTASKFSSRRRALILDLSENSGAACHDGTGGTRRERADGGIGRDWAGEAADFRAARAARWRADGVSSGMLVLHVAPTKYHTRLIETVIKASPYRSVAPLTSFFGSTSKRPHRPFLDLVPSCEGKNRRSTRRITRRRATL